MSILGTVVLLPISLLMEGGAISTALSSASAKFATSGAVPFLWFGAGSTFIPFLLWGGLFYHLYNQTSYMALTGISPLTYSICNTVKRYAPFLPSSQAWAVRPAHALPLCDDALDAVVERLTLPRVVCAQRGGNPCWHCCVPQPHPAHQRRGERGCHRRHLVLCAG
jgi:hypothetical protein